MHRSPRCSRWPVAQAYLSEGPGYVRNRTPFGCSSQSSSQVTAGSAALVALELGKQLVRAGRERDEPGNGPPAVGLTTEYVHALFRSLVLGAIHLCRKGSGQSDDHDIANDDNLVNVAIVVVELDVGSGQHLCEVRADRLSRALHYLRDRVDKIWREEVANPGRVLSVEIGRPALEALHDRRLIGGWISVG